jgi:uncharacterized membrane protein
MPPSALSKHRVEALTDGIFAVAMTLLVIDLKLPEHATALSHDEFMHAVVELFVKFQSWLISFFVLAIFWFAHHRQFHYVRVVDGKLLWLNILYLGFVSLMPFSSALAGQYSHMLLSQIVYSTNMTLLAVGGLLNNYYVYHHQELWGEPVSLGFYRASRMRAAGLIVVALSAIALASLVPSTGNAAFMLMLPISAMSRRLERRTTKT